MVPMEALDRVEVQERVELMEVLALQWELLLWTPIIYMFY